LLKGDCIVNDSALSINCPITNNQERLCNHDAGPRRVPIRIALAADSHECSRLMLIDPKSLLFAGGGLQAREGARGEKVLAVVAAAIGRRLIHLNEKGEGLLTDIDLLY
jgi:hypothetical protein